MRRAVGVLAVADLADRESRQGALEILQSEDFEALDDEFYELEATTDLDGVMDSLAQHSR